MEASEISESPDCCWKCAHSAHHRQECTSNIHPGDEKKIVKLCKRMQKQATNVPEKRAVTMSLNELKCFPVQLLGKYLRMNSMYYYDARMRCEEIGRPTISTEDTRKLAALHHNLNMDIVQQRKWDAELSYYVSKRLLGEFFNATEKEELQWMLEDFKFQRQQTYNLSNKLTLWCYNSIASTIPLWLHTARFDGAMEKQRTIMGRPTIDSIVEGKKILEQAKFAFRVMKREGRVLQNICTAEDTRQLCKLLNRKRLKLCLIEKKLEEADVNFMKETLENEKLNARFKWLQCQDNFTKDLFKKVMCCLCEENEKEWALLCGHMYCGDCITEIEKSRKAEWEVVTDFGVDICTEDVNKECPHCRGPGPLEGKIKLYM